MDAHLTPSQLFGEAQELALTVDRSNGDPDDSRYWEVVYALWNHATLEVWKRTAALCQSVTAYERVLGANVMAQLGMGERRSRPKFWRRSVPLLLRCLTGETAPQVVASFIAALGHMHDPRTLAPIVKFKDHPNADVRWNVAISLTARDESTALEALIELTRDEDSDVRDWATFGLGTQTDVDTPDLRDALVARFDDEDDDTRVEAILGLARRGDKRALEPLLRELEKGSCSPLFEASAFLADAADSRLWELLQTIERDDLPSHWVDDYDQALKKCRPQ